MVQRSRIPAAVVKPTRAILRRMAVYGPVDIGENVSIGRGAIVSSPHGLKIGDHVSIGPRSIIQVDGSIGNFVMIGMGVQIVGREDHAIDQIGVPMLYSTWVADRPGIPRDAVTIGTDVWIGGGSIILSGVKIGDGAIVGAGAVVSRDVEPFTIVAGAPARAVGERFTDENVRAEHLRKLAHYQP